MFFSNGWFCMTTTQLFIECYFLGHVLLGDMLLLCYNVREPAVLTHAAKKDEKKSCG